ncbi:MAG TPA: hypothetical protein VM940_02450 [Chthoniobacterales bacterium]|nr:hypothetical protein [Chthoniobacterales bacterium]
MTKTERFLLTATPILLIFEFLSRLFSGPAVERPSAGLNFLTIMFQIMMVVALVGLAVRRLKSKDPKDGAGPWLVLTGLGLLAGLGLFGFRISGAQDTRLPPRSTESASDLTPPTELVEFAGRLERAGTAYQKAEEAMFAATWAKTADEDRAKLPRRELQHFLAKEREAIAAADKVIELLKEPDAEIKVARLYSTIAAKGDRVPPDEIRMDAWEVRRRFLTVNEKRWALVDAHWDEWRAGPASSEAESKPWQKDLLELDRAGEVAQKEYAALAAIATAPPIEAPMLTQRSGRLTAVVHDIRRQFGAARVLKEIRITRDDVGVVVRDAKNPARTVSGRRNYKSLAKEENFQLTANILSAGEVRETELFGVDEADWARVPTVARVALEKLPLAGGRIIEVALVRRSHPLQENAPEWKVQVKNGGLFDGENGTAFFDARSGELTDLELPKSLVKPAAYLQPENTRALLSRILEDFGPETRFIEFSIEDERALLTATRPKHPDDLRRYGYTATERAKLGRHDPIRLEDPKARNGIFTGAEVREFVPQLDRLRQRAFERLKMKDGRVTRMAFWRQNMVHGTNKKLLLELHCVSPTTKDGTVIYEVTGREFYVALP